MSQENNKPSQPWKNQQECLRKLLEKNISLPWVRVDHHDHQFRQEILLFQGMGLYRLIKSALGRETHAFMSSLRHV